jgi:uncharacterized membrane protein YjgN (DUF898 family)
MVPYVHALERIIMHVRRERKGRRTRPSGALDAPSTGALLGATAHPREDPVATPVERRPSFHGEGSELFGLVVMNVLLSIVTVGIYSFWGRTRMRQYLWSATAFDGDRFDYHGTGDELLRGWLKAIGVLLALYAVMVLMMLAGDLASVLAVLVFWGCLLTLIPFAIFAARRYRLSRTSWRGVRFSQHGDVRAFIKLWVSGALLTGITFTLYRLNETRFGTGRFRYDGEGRELFGRYARAILLTIPTLGLYWFWYWAYRTRYDWEHTSFLGARFSSSVTGGGLLGLAVSNILLILVTLGFGTPWALVRQLRYLTDHVSLVGDVDFAGIIQQVGAAGVGEGFADVLDVGGMDIGM